MAKPDAPIMPEKAKKIRKHRNTRNDKTSVSKEMRDYIKKQDAKNMEEGGMAISDADIASIRRAFGSRGQGGRGISNADMARLQSFLFKKQATSQKALCKV